MTLDDIKKQDIYAHSRHVARQTIGIVEHLCRLMERSDAPEHECAQIAHRFDEGRKAILHILEFKKVPEGFFENGRW